MKLYYSHNLNPRLCVAAARYLEAPVDFVRAAPADPANEAEFRPLNPNCRVPILQFEDGSTLWETDAIVCKLSQMSGSNFWRTGDGLPDMIRWVSWSAWHLTRAGDFFYFHRLVRPLWDPVDPPQDQFDANMADFRHYMGILNGVMADREWLVGDSVSYADFRVGTVFPFADRAGLPLDDFPNVARLAARLNRIDAWRDPFADLD